MHGICLIVVHDEQVYIVYLGRLPSTDADASEPGGFSAVEFAHHGLLNQVLDDGRSDEDVFSVFTS